MTETVFIAIITGTTALLATIVGQRLTRYREERIETLKWQRLQDSEAKKARAQCVRAILQDVLLARERIQLLMPNLTHPGSVASVPGASAGDAARHAYGEALLGSSVLRPQVLAFYQATAKLQLLMESEKGADELALQSMVKVWVAKIEELEDALADQAQ